MAGPSQYQANLGHQPAEGESQEPELCRHFEPGQGFASLVQTVFCRSFASRNWFPTSLIEHARRLSGHQLRPDQRGLRSWEDREPLLIPLNQEWKLCFVAESLYFTVSYLVHGLIEQQKEYMHTTDGMVFG